MAWEEAIQRNAIIILARYKDKTAVPDLIDCLQNDPRPVIRGTAGWALRKIGGSDAEKAVEQALQTEQDEQVLQELTAITN